jgi:hypothetical protein
LRILVVVSVALLAVNASGETCASDNSALRHPLLKEIGGDIRAPELQSTIEKLVGFGTRHTLSDTKSSTRGIGAARRWVRSRFEAFSRACQVRRTSSTYSPFNVEQAIRTASSLFLDISTPG